MFPDITRFEQVENFASKQDEPGGLIKWLLKTDSERRGHSRKNMICATHMQQMADQSAAKALQNPQPQRPWGRQQGIIDFAARFRFALVGHVVKRTRIQFQSLLWIQSVLPWRIL